MTFLIRLYDPSSVSHIAHIISVSSHKKAPERVGAIDSSSGAKHKEPVLERDLAPWQASAGFSGGL
jgi:hypothetical protein